MLSTKIVLEPNDIVLTEICAALYLDKHEVLFPHVFDSVCNSGLDIDRFALGKDDFPAVQSDPSAASHVHPVLRSSRMFLITQALTG